MPTGYTYPVGDGDITDFSKFAWRCTRAMGVMLHMRDDPLDAPIRPRPQSGYYDEHLQKAEAELDRLKKMSAWEIERECQKHNESALERWTKMVSDSETKRIRYQNMLNKVEEWTPPTADHAGFKTFMREQLNESLRHDCHEWPRPQMMDPAEWHNLMIDSAERDCEYYSRQVEEERERVQSNQEWIDQLTASIGAPQ